jgi:hypothetical protein
MNNTGPEIERARHDRCLIADAQILRHQHQGGKTTRFSIALSWPSSCVVSTGTAPSDVPSSPLRPADPRP